MNTPENSILHRVYNLLGQRNIIIISLAATTLLIILQYRIDQQISGDSAGSMYLGLSFTRRSFESVLASWGSAGIARYIETLWIDFLLPVCAAFLLSSAAIAFTRKRGEIVPGGRQFFFMIIPFLYIIAEYTENILHLVILKLHLFEGTLIMTSSIVTVAKLILLYTGIGWMLKCYRDFRKSSTPPAR